MFGLEERERQPGRQTLPSMDHVACMTAKHGSRGWLREKWGAEPHLDGQ